MEVGRKESGEPFVIIHGPGQALLEQRGAVKILLSLSHTDRHAVAVAILEGG
jgi:holo-[acyl-carrier protein] synthase